MRDGIVFCHGFGYDEDYWQFLIPYFADFEIYGLDLGYYGKPYIKLPNNPGQKILGIGHSLGFLKLCQMNLKLDLLVGLNPFVDFLGKERILRRKRELELKMLRSSLLKSPQKCLEEFHARCGAHHDRSKFESLSLPAIHQDLDSLATTISLPAGKKIANKIFLLASEDDPVVPREIVLETCHAMNKENQLDQKETQETFIIKNQEDKKSNPSTKTSNINLGSNCNAWQLEFLESGGHALGYLHHELLHRKIRGFLNEHL
jgi:pimeloyl-[acyl-carrier protein] methyl ester esterase